MKDWRPNAVRMLGLGVLALAGLFYGLGETSDPSPFRSAGLVLPSFGHPRAPQICDAADDVSATDSDKNVIHDALEWRTATLGRGGTLATALERMEVDPDLRQPVIRALAEELDLSRLPAATGLTAGRDGAGRLLQLSLRAEADRFLRWTEDTGAAELVELPSIKHVESGSGRVLQSVRQALDELPWPEELTLAYADVFQWDVDLLVDPRAGDVVRVVYEVETLGQVPEDLPPFGRAASEPGTPLRLGRVLAASYDGQRASVSAYWVDGDAGGGNYYDGEGTPLRKTFLKSPLNYRRISSRFTHARRHPVTRKVVPHHGVDFAAAPGTPVVAAADGRVVETGWQGALGRAVRIRHGSEYVTVYGHLRGFARGLRAGSEVRQNQVIGYVGSTGRATGPHLHYTLIHRGRAIDPLRFRNPPAEPLPAEQMARLERAKLTWAPLLGGQVVVAGAPGVDARPGV